MTGATKFCLVFLCGLVCESACSRMKFERFSEPIFRTDSNVLPEQFFKRETQFQRESPIQGDAMISQSGLAPIMRNGPIFANDQMQPKQIIAQEPIMSTQQFMPQPVQTQQMVPQSIMAQIQNSPMMAQNIGSEQMIPSEQFIRGEPIIRNEPVIRREPIMRAHSIIRAEPIFQNGQMTPVIREAHIFGNEPNTYTLFAQCPYTQPPTTCVQSFGQASLPGQENFFQIQQPVMSPQYFSPRFALQKPVPKSSYVQPMFTVPRYQRVMRKNFRPMPEKVQIQPVTIQTSPDVSQYNSEPVQYPSNSNNFQNPSSLQENTPEPMTTPRTVSQVQNRFPIPPVSSIC